MAERFRFRLPWLTSVTPRLAAGPELPVPPADTPSAPSRPSANIPIQRPPFRPAGTAPVQPSASQSQAPKQAESRPTSTSSATEINASAQNTTALQAPTMEPTTLPQSPEPTTLPQSPPRAATESRVNSQPASPARSPPQPRATSLPPSPSRNSRQPRSPSRLASQRASQANSLPSSPSRRASNVQPTTPQARSPIPNLQPTAMDTMQLPPQSSDFNQGVKPQANPDIPPESLNQKEPEQTSEPEIAAIMQRTTPQPRFPVPDPQPTAKETQQLPSSPVSAPSRPTPSDQGEKLQFSLDAPSVSVKQEEPAQQSDPEITATPAVAASAAPEKSNSEVGADHPATVYEVAEEVKDTKEDHNVEEELTREGKTTSSIVYKEKEPSEDAKLSATIPESTMQAKMPPNVVSRSEQKLHEEKKDTRGRRKHASGFGTEHTRTVRSSNSKASHLPSGSQHNHMMHTADQTPLHKEIQDDISRFVHKLGTGLPNQPGETPVSVVTLAGENSGAFMHLGSELSQKDDSIHIYRGYKSNPDESTGATTTDAEDNWQDNKSKGPGTKEELPVRAYVNSNAQSINNSMVMGSSINEGSPGVQMAYSFSPAEQGSASTKLLPPPAAHKAQVNITRAEKLTHESTVRRRCLRGLFLEPSDSDPDNPEKPRRHGCRYACGDKSSTDKDIGIL